MNVIRRAADPSVTAVLALFWCFSTILILAKRYLSIVNTALTYGKLQGTLNPGNIGGQGEPTASGCPDPKSMSIVRSVKQSVVSLLLLRTGIPPKQGWSLFYTWGIVTTGFCLTIWKLCGFDLGMTTVVLFGLQAIRRLTECLAVHRFAMQPSMTITHLAAGVLFYTVAPVTLCREEMRNVLDRERANTISMTVSEEYTGEHQQVLQI